jgi:NAD(P)-dependent dehydrogenase (short-subunit alcohol dehydrogenase family)
MLHGHVALVTGGASGIGRATAIRLASEGASVVVADTNTSDGQTTVDTISQTGGTARFVATDVAVFEQVEAAVQQAVTDFGKLDIMFNNAGIGHFAPLLQHEPKDYDRVVQVNQYGVYYGILAAARAMVAHGTRGVIINTASVFGFLASQGVFGYHASKGAVKMMTQAAALELAPFGIRVVGIAPGTVDTPIIQGYKDAGLLELLKRQQMRGQLQTPEQIAGVVVMLCTPYADAINGSVIMVDDGYTAFK